MCGPVPSHHDLQLLIYGMRMDGAPIPNPLAHPSHHPHLGDTHLTRGPMGSTPTAQMRHKPAEETRVTRISLIKSKAPRSVDIPPSSGDLQVALDQSLLAR
jgi:hypothetical protein